MIDKVKKEIKYWLQMLLIPLYWFSFLIPKNKKLWVYGSTFGRRFADNPRYFYLYMNQNQRDVDSVWISEKKEIVDLLIRNGYKAHLKGSLKGIWTCLRAKVYLYDNYPKDINHWLSGGAVKINLWHGISLKKIQMDNIFDEVRHPKTFWKRLHGIPRRITDEQANHYILSVSHFFSDICASAFSTKHVLTVGYPRSDIFIGNNINNIYTQSEELCYNQIVKKQKKERKTVFFYMPTFRESESLFFQVMDLKLFTKFLRENKLLFCVKLHCKSKLRKKFEALENDNIVIIEPDTDPNLYLPLADVLITDYSSVYFDYLLLQRPIIFFHYDLKEYLAQSREMYFSYHEFTPGAKVENQEELENCMKQWRDLKENLDTDPHRNEIFCKIYDNPSELASKRLVEEIYKIVG